MKDLNLFLDDLVGPFSAQVELLYEHKASKSRVKLVVLHALENISLEVRVIEGPVLNLSGDNYEQERKRDHDTP